MPFGSRYELFCSGGTVAPAYIGWYCLESINPTLPGKVIERPNPIGGPNGFSIVAAQERMTVKAQLPLISSATLKRGAWFQDTFDPSSGTATIGLPASGGTVETWVVETAGNKFDANGYWYQDLSLIQAHTPPS